MMSRPGLLRWTKAEIANTWNPQRVRFASRRALRVKSRAGDPRPGLRSKGSMRIYLPH